MSSKNKPKAPPVKTTTLEDNPVVIAAKDSLDKMVLNFHESKYNELYEKYQTLQVESKRALEEHISVYAHHSKQLEEYLGKIGTQEKQIESLNDKIQEIEVQNENKLLQIQLDHQKEINELLDVISSLKIDLARVDDFRQLQPKMEKEREDLLSTIEQMKIDHQNDLLRLDDEMEAHRKELIHEMRKRLTEKEKEYDENILMNIPIFTKKILDKLELKNRENEILVQQHEKLQKENSQLTRKLSSVKNCSSTFSSPTPVIDSQPSISFLPSITSPRDDTQKENQRLKLDLSNISSKLTALISQCDNSILFIIQCIEDIHQSFSGDQKIPPINICDLNLTQREYLLSTILRKVEAQQDLYIEFQRRYFPPKDFSGAQSPVLHSERRRKLADEFKTKR